MSKKRLHSIAQEWGSVRAGATDDPQRRWREYQREGYRGTLYYAAVVDMRKEEDALLGYGFRYNVHRKSNVASETRGYVYVIQCSLLRVLLWRMLLR